MNRTILMIAGVFGSSSLLLLDSAVKGTALLLLAAAVALMLRRDSAATRHLVWLLAIVALLAVPVLSAMLPGWRVLPEWAWIGGKAVVVDASARSVAPHIGVAVEAPRSMVPAEVGPLAGASSPPAAAAPDAPPTVASRQAIAAPAGLKWNWMSALPLVWAIGFGVLILRLIAARWILWTCEARGTVIENTNPGRRTVVKRPGSAPAWVEIDPMAAALETARAQLGIVQPVILLLHPSRTIPIVWGIFRCRLLLPEAARDWSAEQLRSVLLHELAHVKRRDMLAQLLTQVACAIHWFNPLVWLAAWRLGVERERACDDLVLASGVRASAYAGHLLDVVTGLSPARWAHSCGLAMARKSSLEGRLLAVLSGNCNRRRVSVALTAMALLIAAGIAVPVAMLRAADQKPGQAPAPAAGADAKAKEGEKLSSAVEEKVVWGQAVNGLRAALVIRNSSDKAQADGVPDLYLLVQNVSDVPIRLNDSITAEGNLRYLTFHRDELPQGRIRLDEPTQTDVTLQPRQATFVQACPLRMTRGQALAAGMLKDPHMILIGEIDIAQAPAGAWKGKLVTGMTGGAAAQIDAPEAPKGAGAPADGAAKPVITKFDAAMEQNLKWGEAVNGLRAAVVFRIAPEQPKAGDKPDLYLALQNVSKEAIRLNDASVPADTRVRELLHKKDGRILYSLGAREPAMGDLTLQAGEVALVPMFDSKTKMTATGDPTVDNHTVGQTIVEGVLKDPHESLMIRMEIKQAPAGAWTGKLSTGDANAAEALGQPQPKDKRAQMLFKMWRDHARRNGDFPGGLIAGLGERVTEFIRANTGDASGDPYAKKMTPIAPRIDATRDWKPDEVIALMDDVAAVSSGPLDAMRERMEQRTFTTGQPLPNSLVSAPWGAVQPSGLRLAWLLEPRAAEHPLGSALKSRILIQNMGKDEVVFRARTWHQGVHTARDANGAQVKVEATNWLTRPPLQAFRLWPGEYVELTATGIGIGAFKNEDDDWQSARVGSWIEASAGDEVTVTTGPVPLSDWNETPAKNGEAGGWWVELIKAHLAQELPQPADAEERRQIVYRAGMAIFGTPLSKEEIAAFVEDHDATALDALAVRFAKRAGTWAASGELSSAPTKFKVLPADPDAAKRPRVASNPGRYTLGENIRLIVTRRPKGERIVNEGRIQFFSADPKAEPLGKSVDLKLPDGYDTWAASWERGTTVLWVMKGGKLHRYDFTNPAEVKESGGDDGANPETTPPKAILDALHAAIAPPAAPAGRPAATAAPR